VAARSKGWPISVLAYTAATIVAIDRVNSRVHFTSDVVAGAFIGTAIGRFLVKRHNDEKAGVLSKADPSAAASPRVCDLRSREERLRAGAARGVEKKLE
jgi:membrane-associated phospholipid phosphatase